MSKLPLDRVGSEPVLVGPGRKGGAPAMGRRSPAQVHIAHGVGKPVGRGEAFVRIPTIVTAHTDERDRCSVRASVVFRV